MNSKSESPGIPVTVHLDPQVHALLAVLAEDGQNVAEVIERLCDHAQQGVYRPGAWVRSWLEQVFGEDWQERLEPGDPYGRKGCEKIFERPRVTLIRSRLNGTA